MEPKEKKMLMVEIIRPMLVANASGIGEARCTGEKVKMDEEDARSQAGAGWVRILEPGKK